MATTTPKLGLPRPEGSDNVTRSNNNELIDKIDEAAASQADLDSHRNATIVHGATSSPSANRMALRDANGQFEVGTPTTANHVSRKGDLDAHIADYVRQPGYAADTGTANAKVITLNPAPAALVDGLAISFKNAAQNTGAVTLNVNGLGAKAIMKSNGGALTGGNLRSGSIYTVRYDATTENFILQGEGGSGNAQPGDVLNGRTFTNDDGEQTGTMPNRGAVNQTLSTQGQEYTVPNGFHNGSGKVTANISNLTAGNVRSGANVGGVAGTFSQFSNGATAAQILTGRSASVNGADVDGIMANRTGHVTGQSISRTGTTLRIRPQAGYYPGGTDNSVQYNDPNWVAANIAEGVSVFGLSGTAKRMPEWISNFFAYYSGDEISPIVVGPSQGSGSQSKASDHLYLSVTASQSWRGYQTGQGLNITGLSYVFLELYDFELISGTSADVSLSLSLSGPGYRSSSVNPPTSNGKLVISLDGLQTGTYNIYAQLTSRQTSTISANVKIKGIYWV